MQKFIDVFVSVGVLRSFGLISDEEAQHLYSEITKLVMASDFFKSIKNGK